MTHLRVNDCEPRARASDPVFSVLPAVWTFATPPAVAAGECFCAAAPVAKATSEPSICQGKLRQENFKSHLKPVHCPAMRNGR